MARKWQYQVSWFAEPTSDNKQQFENALDTLVKSGGQIVSVVPATGGQWAVIYRAPLKTPPTVAPTYPTYGPGA